MKCLKKNLICSCLCIAFAFSCMFSLHFILQLDHVWTSGHQRNVWLFKAMASNWQCFNIGYFTKTLLSEFVLFFLFSFYDCFCCCLFVLQVLCSGIWELVASFHIDNKPYLFAWFLQQCHILTLMTLYQFSWRLLWLKWQIISSPFFGLTYYSCQISASW